MSGRSRRLADPYCRGVRRTRRACGLLLLFVLAAFLVSCSSTPKRPIPIAGLSNNFEPLRSQFNKDAGKVRLVILLDPT